MTTLTFTYDADELGWKTDKVKLSRNIAVEIELKKRGRVAIKKGNTLNGPFPKIYVSPITDAEHQYVIDGDVKDKYIQIVTSEEPNYIKYANI